MSIGIVILCIIFIFCFSLLFYTKDYDTYVRKKLSETNPELEIISVRIPNQTDWKMNPYDSNSILIFALFNHIMTFRVIIVQKGDKQEMYWVKIISMLGFVVGLDLRKDNKDYTLSPEQREKLL
jgi:hypothetical protein